jgi:hypothetical protein
VYDARRSRAFEHLASYRRHIHIPNARRQRNASLTKQRELRATIRAFRDVRHHGRPSARVESLVQQIWKSVAHLRVRTVSH